MRVPLLERDASDRGSGSIEMDEFEVVLAYYGLSKVADVGLDDVE